ncbi:hypothetical protein [Faecalicoccus pleomorphus]|uniref:hypothetical protein n=1 Tax=Faecalicoccus pleomorphus TaxID=1323 RepID=UPI00242B0BAF|nr:hypothetical protein [Faecalicoccus pleomorphus]
MWGYIEGILNRYQHTSNALFYLQSIDTYRGSSYYIDKVSVQDQNLITASFAGSLLRAKYIMENLKLYSEQTLDAWYRYFSTGQVEYFEKLIASFMKKFANVQTLNCLLKNQKQFICRKNKIFHEKN